VEFISARDLDQYSIDAEIGLLKVSVFEPIKSDDYSPEVADRRLQAILRTNVTDTHALTFLGEVYRGVDKGKALEYYNLALTADSNNALAYFGKAVLLDTAGKREDALAFYEKAVALSPWNQTFLNDLAYQHFLGRNYEKAEELYIRLLSLDSRFLLSYYILAHSQLLRDRDAQAYQSLRLLDQLLNDDATSELSRNRSPWFFHVYQSTPVYLYTKAEKRACARYVLALAAYLVSRPIEAQQHLTAVDELGPDAAQASRLIMLGDVRRLQAARPQQAAVWELFRSRLLRERN